MIHGLFLLDRSYGATRVDQATTIWPADERFSHQRLQHDSMSDSEPQSTLGAALAAIQASVSTETTDADATALATADSAAHGASVKVVAATPANSRRRNSSTSAKGEEVKPASAKKKGHPAVGSEVESETAEAVEDSSASGSGEEAPQKEGPANPKKVQGKDVETSALPVPMIDNGDFVETRPRKSLRVSNRESTQPPKAEKKESFPQQIHRFVTDMMTTNPAMITFTDDGEKIQVREDHPDIGEFMEESVGNAHLGFFSQKLLSYGWSRDSDPKYVPLAMVCFYQTPAIALFTSAPHCVCYSDPTCCTSATPTFTVTSPSVSFLKLCQERGLPFLRSRLLRRVLRRPRRSTKNGTRVRPWRRRPRPTTGIASKPSSESSKPCTRVTPTASCTKP